VRALLALVLGIVLASCTAAPSRRVDPADYDAFWLWAGVTPRPVLKRAKTLYLLAGEIRRDTGRFVSLRPGTPHLPAPEIWLVVRVDTLDWQPETIAQILAAARQWQAAGNLLAGVQIDFDARTRHLDQYAAFLRNFRAALPKPLRLSVTGLMDWSANGDPAALQALAATVDEVVIQTYQGRQTIAGYDRYFARIGRLHIPFKIGLVQGGEWREPAGLARNPFFRGYAVFLTS
jgi:hypothetical protein